MSLEPVKLDDLTWSGMVTAIRRRIPAAANGQWTLHAPVDPGVTLLELFAWLLEQRLYWMDQTSDSLVRASFALLGETLRPAQAASTAMKISSPKDFHSVAAQVEMRLLGKQPSPTPLIFSTDAGALLLPIEKIGLRINNKDRTQDLEQGRVMRLFPADGGVAEIEITLGLTKGLPPMPHAEPMALLFDLRAPSGIKPQWSREAPQTPPPPATLEWMYRAAPDRFTLFPKIDDGTGGLRRSGIVRLWLPADWQADKMENGVTFYSLKIRTARSTFTAPPRLNRLIPNVAICSHRRSELVRLQPRWRPLPGNVIALEAASPPLEQTVKLRIKERDGEWRDWKLAQDLAFQGPADRIFLVDREKGVIHFGDGLTGRLPVTPQEVEVRYQAGGGRIGNLGANLSWEGRMDDTLTATNVVQADGGAESETMEAARQRVASTIKHRYRAVTREDYEEIARGLTDVRTGVTPGVAIKRAHAALGFHPGHPCSLVPGAVTVFIVPDAPREKPGEDMDEDFVESAFVAAPTPDPGALDAVRARLERARLVTAEVFVLPPRYVKTSLRVTVESDSPEPIKLREQITERLQEFLDPLIGGDDRLGWPFGEPLRPSVLLREAQRAMDDAGEAVAVAIKLVDNDAPEEDCEEVRIGENDLIELVEVNVSFQRAAAIRGAGGLR